MTETNELGRTIPELGKIEQVDEAPLLTNPGRTIPELGKIEQVEVRGIWLNEAHDFTPWMARHLDLLGDALGMELDLVQREAAVGDFSLDIHATERHTGAVVVIENQLERTDHTHLGQILVYAGGQDARTVVWVAPYFRDEHRGAIDWLNRWTPEEIAFFGVEVSAIKIGDSLPAPVFRPVAFPNDWTKQPKPKPTDPSSDKERRIEFYQPLVDKLRERGYSMPAQARSWWNPVQTGVGEITYYPYLVAKGPSVYVEIWTGDRERDAQIYEKLLEEKASIEGALPLPLTWAKTSAKTLKVTMEGGKPVSVNDPLEKLQEARDWLLENLPKFIGALNPRLEKIIDDVQAERSAPPDADAPEADPDA